MNGSKRIIIIGTFLNESKNLSTSIDRNGLKRLKNQNFQERISLNEKKIPASLMLGKRPLMSYHFGEYRIEFLIAVSNP